MKKIISYVWVSFRVGSSITRDISLGGVPKERRDKHFLMSMSQGLCGYKLT